MRRCTTSLESVHGAARRTLAELNGPGADHAVKGNRLVVRSGPGLRVGPRTAVFGPSGQIRIIALQFIDLRCLGQVFRTASVASERDASSHPVARTCVSDRRWREDPLGAVDGTEANV